MVFPLRFVPPDDLPAGVLHWLYHMLWAIDLPRNMLPSLHVAVTLVVWAEYIRQLKGYPRYAVHAAFTVIVLSTLLTRQHHVPDVLAGFVLGLASLFAVRLRPA